MIVIGEAPAAKDRRTISDPAALQASCMNSLRLMGFTPWPRTTIIKSLIRSWGANAVRLQLHALAYNLGNFLRTLATPEPIKDWSLTSLKDNQDRREGGEPRPLCGLPNGGGRHRTANVPGDSAAHRGTAAIR